MNPTDKPTLVVAPELNGAGDVVVVDVLVIREDGETDERYARRCALQRLVSLAQEMGSYE